MKQILWIALLLAAFMLVCGCTQQNDVPHTPIPSATVTPAGSLPAELSSSTPNTTLSLDAGVLLISFHAAGAQEMEIGFSNVSGAYGETESFSTTGPYDGSLVFGVLQKDNYLLNISGTGLWTAEVSQYAPDGVLKAPLNLSGNGTEVPPVLYLEKGQYLFKRNETGSFVMDANNSYVQPGFGELSTETFKFITIPESGDYILSVVARENPASWAASILTAPTLPALRPGPEIPENETPSA
ncbi:MAG: hypothetical protein PWP08_669 [Methanofollis sp.]|nr:hypothetical protein [Methanofollis sp.]